MAVRRSGLTSSAVGGAGSGGFRISGVASGRPGCGGGFRGDDGCTPSMGLSVDTEFSSVVRDSDSPLVWVAQKPRGGSAGPRSAGAYIGDVVLPVTAWPACRLRWTALIGQLPMGVHGSRGF